MKTYDVCVLGGGTAGTAAAKAAHAAGARTVMFNDGELGGLCILRGCMPTKTMLHAAHLVHEAGHHRTPGIGHAELDVDFEAVMANKDAKVARFKAAKIRGIEAGGYDVVDARARFVGEDTVEAGGDTYRFERGAVIATGSATAVPPIDGVADVPFLASDDLMELRERPRSMIVLGSGAIGLEFAQFYARMGVRVEHVSRRAVFTDYGPVITEAIAGAIHDEPNFHSHCGTAPARIATGGDGVVMTLTDGKEVTAEHLVLATGRRANVDGLGLDAAGIAFDGKRVTCGVDMRTTNERVFVAGDASGSRLLLHVANWEGRVAGLGAAQVPGEHAVEQRLHMEVVFTDPPFASIGMTEAAATTAGHDVVTATERFAETGRAITMDVAHGAIVLVADRSTGELLGCQMLGPRADDVIHAVSAVMFYRGTTADMLRMPWYHPTISEVLLGLARSIDAARS